MPQVRPKSSRPGKWYDEKHADTDVGGKPSRRVTQGHPSCLLIFSSRATAMAVMVAYMRRTNFVPLLEAAVGALGGTLVPKSGCIVPRVVRRRAGRPSSLATKKYEPYDFVGFGNETVTVADFVKACHSTSAAAAYSDPSRWRRTRQKRTACCVLE